MNGSPTPPQYRSDVKPDERPRDLATWTRAVEAQLEPDERAFLHEKLAKLTAGKRAAMVQQLSPEDAASELRIARAMAHAKATGATEIVLQHADVWHR